MSYKSTQKQYTIGRVTLPIVYVIAILGWVIPLLISNNPTGYTEVENPIWQILPLNAMPIWLHHILAFASFALIGYFMIFLNNQFIIIKRRATIQTSLLFLFVTAILNLHSFQPLHLAAVVFALHTFFLFKSHRESRSQDTLFFSGFLLALCFIAVPKTLFIVPVILITEITFYSLNIKTFLASLLGFSLPIWLLFGHAYWYDQMEFITYPFLELGNWEHFLDYSQIQIIDWITIGFLAFLSCLSIVYLLYNRNREKVRTREILNHFLRVTLAVLVLIVLDPSLLYTLTPILLIPVSFIYGHSLMISQTRMSYWLFVSLMTLLFTLYLANLWIL